MMRAGLGCGLVAPLLWAAVIVMAGAMRPGFDHAGQYISELGERGSTTEFFMRHAGFVATGLLHIAYAVAFRAALVAAGARPRLALIVGVLVGLNGLGRIGAGIFPCEPGCAAPDVLGQRLHGLSATLAFLAMVGATLLAAPLFRGLRQLRALAPYSLATGAAALVFLALMSASEATRVDTGLYERLASGALTLWVFATAWQLRGLGRDRA